MNMKKIKINLILSFIKLLVEMGNLFLSFGEFFVNMYIMKII